MFYVPTLCQDTLLYTFFSNLHENLKHNYYYSNSIDKKTEQRRLMTCLRSHRKLLAEQESNHPSSTHNLSTTKLTSGKNQS